MRMMAARGLAPLPPRDLLVAMYQVWVGADPNLAEEAGKGVLGLPSAVLQGALADPSLPAGVLDFVGRKFVRDEAWLAAIVKHSNVDDETLVGIARVCPDAICDLLAENQRRWISCPAIVTSLYGNPSCRMSVMHRMLEFAVRENLDLKLPMMDEIRAALRNEAIDTTRDELFRSVTVDEAALADELARISAAGAADAIGPSPEEQAALDAAAAVPPSELAELGTPEAPTPEVEGAAAGEADAGEAGDEGAHDTDASAEAPDISEDAVVQQVLAEVAAAGAAEGDVGPSRERRLTTLMKMRPIEKIRAAMLGDAFDRSVLVRDSNKIVAMAAIKSPKIKDSEAVAYSSNRALSHDVIRYISTRRDWVKLYSVKLNLVMNPKTPMAKAMTLLAFLNAGDVQKVARSKNISSALSQAARRKLQNRK
jgi:hypothetical protein